MVTISKKKSFLNSGPFTHVSHYWWKQSFHFFGTGFERPLARLQTTSHVYSYPSRHLLSQYPHLHPSQWVARGHQGRQNRQHRRNGWKVHKPHKCSSHSAPYKPHGVGTWKHFFGSKSKKTKRFMIFDPKKRGGHFFDIFDPPPSPPSKPQKSGYQVGGGGLGRCGPKTHWGMRLLDKIMILQGVKQMRPLEVRYTNSPKKAQKGGGMWRFPLYTGLLGCDLTTSARWFYCLWQVHLAENLPQATHTQNSVKTT